MTENKENFILQIILSNTQGSSFQHGKVYKKNVSRENKEKFVKAFRDKLK